MKEERQVVQASQKIRKFDFWGFDFNEFRKNDICTYFNVYDNLKKKKNKKKNL